MKKNVVISLMGVQRYDETPPDVIELVTQGQLHEEEDGALVLTYEESELTGLEGTTTTFVIDGGMVTLTRSGELNSQMIFQMGKRHTSLYETPWGTLTVDVTTTGLSCRMDAHGGILDIRYSIAVDHQVTGENRFKVRVREAAR